MIPIQRWWNFNFIFHLTSHIFHCTFHCTTLPQALTTLHFFHYHLSIFQNFLPSFHSLPDRNSFLCQSRRIPIWNFCLSPPWRKLTFILYSFHSVHSIPNEKFNYSVYSIFLWQDSYILFLVYSTEGWEGKYWDGVGWMTCPSLRSRPQTRTDHPGRDSSLSLPFNIYYNPIPTIPIHHHC